MQIRLSYKLFGAFFLILGIVVGAMMLSRYIFLMNFKRYIRQVEMGRLEQLVPALEAAYRAHGGWDGVRADISQWRRYLTVAHDPDPSVLPSQIKIPSPVVAPAQREPRRGPPEVLLTDNRRQALVGTPEADDQPQLVAIRMDGRVVGWLGLKKREPFKGPPAALLERQTRHLYLLGAVVIGLTALIAFLFSRHLLKPIHRLARGTRELAGPNFKTRIEPGTRDELGLLAVNFNHMAQTLENYEQARRQWLTDISHELRTPLAVLRGEIEAIQDGVRKPSPDNLASLHAEILRISKLVEDLHLLSLTDSDRLVLNRQTISPRRVLDTLLDNFGARLARRQIAVDTDLHGIADVRVDADADRLDQVFTNVLENVCRYVSSPGTLKITGRADDRWLTLRFEDSGPGVAEADLPRLFDRLYRVENSRNRDSGGSGLGLSICRHIIEHHGGRIWAENSSLGGLCVGIGLPLSPLPEGGAR